MPRRKAVAIVLVLASLAAIGGCALFGKPDYCTKRRQGSFATFLDDEWRTYCEEFRSHADSPGSYSLEELTLFFGKHPARVTELQDEMIRFEEPKACFTEPREKLEYRRLSHCLEYEAEQQQVMIESWTARAQPWLEDIALTLRSVRPKVDDAAREADRLVREAEEAFSYEREMNPSDFEEFARDVDRIEETIAEADDVDERYRALVEMASGAEVLTSAMHRDFGPRVAEFSEDITELQKRLATVKKKERFVEFTVHGAGKKCPEGVDDRQTERAARKLLKEKVEEVGGLAPRISKPIETEEGGPVEYQRFAGFVCGIRTEENQFDGRTRLCGKYTFEFERTKGHNVDDWEAWKMKSFEESGPEGSIDCSLMK